jgi:hypothetical protein
MSKIIKGTALAVALCVAAQPAQAAMGCWNAKAASAAQVRDLQSRLMVASLRCRAMGFDILPAYNRFVRNSRDTLQQANGLIKARFTAGFGAKGGQVQYDKFTTALANAYGADDTSREICRDTADLAEEAADADGDMNRLVDISERMGGPPKLPGSVCSVVLAGKDRN